MGAVNLVVGGKTIENVLEYNSQENATTLDPGNYDGGSTQITASALDDGKSRERMSQNLVLSDSLRGSLTGIVRTVNSTDGIVTYTADTGPAYFNAFKTAKPYYGTFQNAMIYYFSLVSSVYTPVFDTTAIANRAVSYPGFKGNLWDMLKQILAAEQLELVFSATTGMFRAPRPFRVDQKHLTTKSYTVDTAQTAKQVRVHYYGNKYVNDGEIYPITPNPPLPGEDPQVDQADIYSVDANQTYTVDIQLNASMDNVNQPTCVDFVYNQSYAGTNGVYAVAGNDGLPITAAQWNAKGGRLTVKVTDDPSVVRVTIVGANIPAYAPFQIAMTAGDSSYYNSLHLTGDGVFQTDQVVDIFTGAGDSATGEDIGIEVTNPFISTLSQAMWVGQRTAGSTAINYTIGGTADGFPLFRGAELGQMIGSTIQSDNAIFRLTDISSGADSVTYTAKLETLVDDFNQLGLTTAQFNALWAGKNCLNFSLDPLKKA